MDTLPAGVDVAERAPLPIVQRAGAEDMNDLAVFPQENPNPVLRIDGGGHLLYANESSAVLLQIWQREFGDRLPPILVQAVSAALATQTNRVTEWEDGSRVFSFWVVPLAATGYVNLYGHDITARAQAEAARQQAEEALREREARLRQLTDNMTDMIAQFDRGAYYEYVSPSYEKVLGYRAEELVGTPATDLLHPDEKEAATQAIDAMLRTGAGSVQFRYRHKDGHYVWVESTGRNLVDADGQVRGSVMGSRDVTQRKAAEENLKRMVQRFNLAARAARLGVWDWDIQKDELVWDDRMYELYGVERQDFGGAYQAWLHGVHPDDRAYCDEVSGQARRGERDYDTEFRVVWPDGSVHHLKAYGEFVRDVDGAPLRMTGINYDITEQKQAEEALRESEERYRTLFNEMLDGFALHEIICDENGQPVDYRFLDINPAFEALTGLQASDVIGKTVRQVLPDTESYWIELYGQVALTGQPLHMENSSGVLGKYFEVMAYSPERGKFVTVFADVTKRKVAEEELRETRDYLEKLLDYANAPIIVWDPQFRVTRFNHAFEHLTGLTAAQVLGRHLALLFPLESCAASLARIEQTLGGEQWESVEIPIQRQDGQVRVVLWNSANIYAPHSRTLVAVVAQGQDITERVQAEEGIRQMNAELEQRVEARTAELQVANAALQRAARMKDVFLANMSHELRTPLAGILGLSEALQLGVYGPLTDKQSHSLQGIHESGQHLLSLITDILDLSKIEAGTLALECETVSVPDLCRASLQFIKQLARKKNIEVHLALDPGVEQLQADGRRLKQMLVNLLSNAVKFTPEGGQIGLQVQGEAAEGQVRFSVWDTGIGIPPEKQSLLFMPFVQLDGALSRQYEGAGLGLALVRRMAELHGGSVMVESQGVGRGSRFILTLPWRTFQAELPLPAPATSTEPLLLAGRSGRSPLVLLVDDNPGTLLTVADYLEVQGARVLTATDGPASIACARDARPDVILMDIQMPGMDGLEAIRSLRQDPAQAQCRIIALTALAMPGDRERCLDAGADEYMSKPVSLVALARAIARLLSG